MKKYLILLITIITVFSLTACFAKAPQQTDGADSISSNEKDEDTNDQDSSDNDTVAEGMVFVEQDDIKISAPKLAFEDEFWGPEMTMLVENDTDQNITATVSYAAVNGLMIGSSFYSEVQSGKKANEVFYITAESLTMSGITTIDEVVLVFEVYDTDTWDTIFTTDTISFNLSNGSYEQDVDDSGEVAVDNGDYKIVIQGLDTEYSYYGADVYVYLENNTDKPVTFQSDNVSVNGFMIYPSFYCDVLPGMKAVTTLSFYEGDLTDNDITDIEEIELIFYVYDYESWSTVYESDTLVITF